MSIREGIDVYYGAFGFRGLLAISSFRLFGRPKVIAGQPAGIKHPVHLRVRTSDLAVYHHILLEREYEVSLPFSPRTIVDVGANIGLTTISYANQYPDAKIVAIEPKDANFAALVMNVAPYPNVVPIHAALWNKDGEVAIRDVGGDWECQVCEGSGCRAITMRTLMAEAGIDLIDLLKVDVEGAEKEIFLDCDWMDRVRVLIVELHDRFKPGCREAVEGAAKGFRQHESGELTFFSAI